MKNGKLANSASVRRESEAPKGKPSPSSGTFPRTLGPKAGPRILQHPDPRLFSPSLDVDPHDLSLLRLAETLVATMKASPACVGLAAPQIGAFFRLFCMDVTGHPKANSNAGLVVVANPRIVAFAGKKRMREGCLSVPHLTGDVVRAESVTVVGFEPGTYRTVEIRADGIEARCIQHEIDHLDGYLFVDRVQDATTDLFARKTYASPG
jgi:peptide deformylase